jgi:hypothetical protein
MQQQSQKAHQITLSPSNQAPPRASDHSALWDMAVDGVGMSHGRDTYVLTYDLAILLYGSFVRQLLES